MSYDHFPTSIAAIDIYQGDYCAIPFIIIEERMPMAAVGGMLHIRLCGFPMLFVRCLFTSNYSLQKNIANHAIVWAGTRHLFVQKLEIFYITYTSSHKYVM